MQNLNWFSAGLVVVCGSALSCGPGESDSGVLEGTGGRTADPGGAGGTLIESGGDVSIGTGGSVAMSTGGSVAISTGGSVAMSTGGSGPAGSGSAATGGSNGYGGAGTGAIEDLWGGLKNPPRKSDGCGKAAAVASGKKTIMSGGKERAYIIDVPADYDPNKPYRLFYASHGLGGRAEDVAGWNYFDLKREATAAKAPAVFIAPQGIDGRWGEADHLLFDDITSFAKNNLCIDTTRVFVTGMSFGGMITYSLSTNHQKRFRAGVALAPANYNIWLPNPKQREPIAWMHTTGMGDTTCPWDAGNNRGSRYIALEKAADNGCKLPASIPTWQTGKHLCYDFEGCRPGYPVKACTFDGGHVQSNADPGTSTNWIAKESWNFFAQF
jgi:poly(3-hydroxybutyrate) depolymerase